MPTVIRPVLQSDAEQDIDSDLSSDESFVTRGWHWLAYWIGRVLEGLIGAHGILIHYPVMVVGFLGFTLVVHRNWTGVTKTLALVSLTACTIAIVMFAIGPIEGPMSYGAPWFLCLSPMLVIWSGAWLKRHHRPQSYVLAGLALAYSMSVSLVGMSDPIPRQGYAGYSFAEAAARLTQSNAPAPRRFPATLQSK